MNSGSPPHVKRMSIGRTRSKIPQIFESWKEGKLDFSHMFSATGKERSASVGVTAFEYYSRLPSELRAMMAESAELSIVEMALRLEQERVESALEVLHMMADLDVR